MTGREAEELLAAAGTSRIYEQGRIAALLARERILVDAVPPFGRYTPKYQFAVIRGGLLAPSHGDAYVVELRDSRSFRILAYLDRFGRAFSTNTPLRMPPARLPDLVFQRAERSDDSSDETRMRDVWRSDSRTRSASSGDLRTQSALSGEARIRAPWASRTSSAEVRTRAPWVPRASSAESPSRTLQAQGCVEVLDQDYFEGTFRTVAEYRRDREGYRFSGSWFDFGAHGSGLSYYEALARAYLAFVYRPMVSGAPKPTLGAVDVKKLLENAELFPVANLVIDTVEAAQADPATQVPGLVSCLSRWLVEAGVGSEFSDRFRRDSDDLPLRLAHVGENKKLFFLSSPDRSIAAQFRSFIWGLESALNRFALVAEKLGVRAATASEEKCAACADELLDSLVAPELCTEDVCGVAVSGVVDGADMSGAAYGAAVPGVADGARPANSAAADGVRPADSAATNSAPADGAGFFGGAGSRSVQPCAEEWDARVAIARGFERLAAPIRIESNFRTNVRGGYAAFELTVPGGAIISHSRWSQEQCGWFELTEKECRARAHRYALRASLAAATIAFRSSAKIQCVRVGVCSVQDAPYRDKGPDEKREFPAEEPGRCSMLLQFRRVNFFERGADAAPPDADLEALCAPFVLQDYFEQVDTSAYTVAQGIRDYASYSAKSAEAYTSHTTAHAPATGLPDIASPLKELRVSPPWRNQSPELANRMLSDVALRALGAQHSSDLGVDHSQALRALAESMADDVVNAQSTTERIRLVSAVRDTSNDPAVKDACTRLMVALTEGSVAEGDQNAIVNSFLGEDALSLAYLHARRLLQEQGESAAEEAASILREAIAACDAAGRYVDTATTVYRCFDSYAARVLYNLERERGGFAHDAGRSVELAPDSLYYCCLAMIQQLERLFNGTEEALHYGSRCIELGPLNGSGYLQTARAHMLIGDMEKSTAVLNDFLSRAFQRVEIAFAYYQLAYTEWKSGHHLAGAAGYVKAMLNSVLVYGQARLELEELISEEDIAPIIPDEVDEVLKNFNIAVAPSQELLDQLLQASKAAVDEGLFVVARSTLASYCQFRPDDVLLAVLSSLDQ